MAPESSKDPRPLPAEESWASSAQPREDLPPDEESSDSGASAEKARGDRGDAKTLYEAKVRPYFLEATSLGFAVLLLLSFHAALWTLPDRSQPKPALQRIYFPIISFTSEFDPEAAALLDLRGVHAELQTGPGDEGQQYFVFGDRPLAGDELREVLSGDPDPLPFPIGDVLLGRDGERPVFLAQVSTADLLLTDLEVAEASKYLEEQTLVPAPTRDIANRRQGLNTGVAQSGPPTVDGKVPSDSNAPAPYPPSQDQGQDQDQDHQWASRTVQMDVVTSAASQTPYPGGTAFLTGSGLSHPKVVAAATLQALVRAERLGIRHLQMELLAASNGELPLQDALKGMAEGIARATPSLRTLHRLDFVLPADQDSLAEQLPVLFPSDDFGMTFLPLSTPLRWPGQGRFAIPGIGQAQTPISGAFAATAPITYGSGLAFFGLLFLFLGGLAHRSGGVHAGPLLWSDWRHQLRSKRPGRGDGAAKKTTKPFEEPLSKKSATDKAAIDGAPGSNFSRGLSKVRPSAFWPRAGLWLLLGLIFYLAQRLVLDRLWIWAPDTPLPTAPGITALALAFAGALSWGLRVFYRRAQEAEARRVPDAIERDPVLRTALFRDIPISDVSQNRLGFGPLVEAFRRFLDNAATEPPVIMAINGPWGSGKSSLMSMVASELGKTRRFHTVWFNAWRYQNEEQAMAAFLQALARQLSEDWGIWRSLRIAWVRFRGLGFTKMLMLLSPLAAVLLGLRAGIDPSDFFGPLLDQASRNDGEGTKLEIAGALAVLGGGLVGFKSLPWLFSLFRPFRLRFEKLFETQDYSARIGFLDEFTREFRLYRKAAGSKKLLVVVDDLDRCSPEHVVDVLKAINLIVTSDTGAGKTFFLLGFDRDYVRKAIREKFSKFAAGDPLFSEQYLKKMITLGVSVPAASNQAIQQLLVGIDRAGTEQEAAGAGAKNQDSPSWLDHATLLVRRVPAWVGNLAAAAGVLGVMAMMVPVAEAPHEVAQVVAPAEVAAEVADSTGEAGDVGRGDDSPIRAIVSTLDASQPPQETDPWWAWLPVMLLVSVALFAMVSQRPVAAEARYRREEKDSRDFQEAIRQCAPLLPDNPRDAIRLVNRLRMGWLVQSDPGGSNEDDPLPGRPLTEKEYILLGTFFERFPTTLATGLSRGVPAAAEQLLQRLPDQVTGDFSADENAERDRSQNLLKVFRRLGENGVDTAVLERPELLKRFETVNRHLSSPLSGTTSSGAS